MAATIAKAIGSDKSRRKETHRLGSLSAEVEAATWHTKVHGYVARDGSGYATVSRNGVILNRFTFGPEGTND